MVSRIRLAPVGAALTLALALAMGSAAPASADLNSLFAACSGKDALDANTGNGVTLPFTFCDDGRPPTGGATPNVGAVKAVAVPAAYTGAGQPTKHAAAALAVPGNAGGDIALDVDVSLPRPPANPPAGNRYPVVVLMHGCCGGDKTGWEGTTIDPGGKENWHYNNAWFASRGYVVVTYTARGFVNGSGQGSTGQTQLDSNRFEINDYQHLVGQLVDRGDLDPGPGVVKADPARIVPTGGSYGGGFTWMAFTDPTWNSPGGTPMKVVVAAPKFGWTDLVEALVPNGGDRRDALPTSDISKASQPFGFPKRTINNALYLSGKVGFPGQPPNNPHTTFAPDIDQAQACLSSTDPYAQNPLCATTIATALPRFYSERSAYYQNGFFARLASGSLAPVPVFSAGALTDPLFPAAEHRRMVERLKQVRPGYPVQEYYGDYNHFVQDKRKEWADLCGADHHPCTYADYPGGDFNATPPSLAREFGVTTRLNRFVDHYAKPPRNPSQPRPAFDVTASLQVCPENAGPEGIPGDEPGLRFTASTFRGLAPGSLDVSAIGAQPTVNKALPNHHAVRADPVANTAANGSRCPVEDSPGGFASAGPGVATYDSEPLPRDFIVLGQTRATIQHTGAGAGIQLNARLYDLGPDGTQVMVDRGTQVLAGPNGTTILDLHGNGWRFRKGHRVRIELAQDDDPYVKSSTQPSSLVLSGVKLQLPVRGASAVVPGEPAGRVIRGTPGDDLLVGTPGDDLIICGAGDDVVRAGAGDDRILCGPGNDRIDAGSGRDRVRGGSGRDRVLGRSGNDRVRGESGRDRLNGGTGRDRLDGGRGNDRLRGSRAGDRLLGGRGNDRLRGEAGNDRLFGNSGRDRLYGGRGRDRLRGGSGRDRLRGGPGRDRTRQ